jgi:hypothetical protein
MAAYAYNARSAAIPYAPLVKYNLTYLVNFAMDSY